MFDVQTAIPSDDTASTEASATVAPAAAAPAASERRVPLPLRNDTLLGVCEAIGEDFGFNANLLRIALAIGLFWSPVAMIALYLGLGAAVAVSRFFFPAAARKSVSDRQEQREEPLPLAA